MRRREFIIGGAAALWPLVAHAQQGKVYQIGYLGFGIPAESQARFEALRAGLRDRGYVEGKNVVIEFRLAETVEGLRDLAAELVRRNVDLIFATSSTETNAARQATKTMPIVFATHADPVGLGHVASLSRPGGNITGLSMLLTELVAKELEILKEALPHVTHIGVLLTSTAPSHHLASQAAEVAGKKLGVQIQNVLVRSGDDFDGALAMMARERVGGFVAAASPLTRSQRALLAELSLKHKLPSMFGTKENVEAGGLMSYAPDLLDLTRRAATYIDKILKGTKPADLPVEQASRYQLVINLKTAKALGLAISPIFLTRADEVIE